MPDWADTEASDLVERHTIMQGDRLVALKGTIEAAIAAKLRTVRMAAAIDTGQKAETAVRSLYGAAS